MRTGGGNARCPRRFSRGSRVAVAKETTDRHCRNSCSGIVIEIGDSVVLEAERAAVETQEVDTPSGAVAFATAYTCGLDTLLRMIYTAANDDSPGEHA